MNRRIIRRLLPVLLTGAALPLLCARTNDFGLGRSMEIAVNMMRELSLRFVDEVDPDLLIEGAAEGMVRRLDPYTEYLSEEQMGDFDILTTGKYGGVGSLIRKRGDYVVFARPYRNSPADKAGLRIGDKILAIDGADARGFSVAEASGRMKGDPGTEVTLVVEHLLDGRVDTATLRRERIAIPGVPYAGWVADGIGYVQHSDFTEGCYDDLRAAVEGLAAEGDLRGLILDYRNNGGGILQEAVKILSMFVPKGTEVVTTRGRTDNKSFRTAADPILPELPLAVLVNGNTASAAEIVAGALQDLDRAVIVGQRSFGKGLVQSTRPLGYNTYLKLTTAKYYIPSGRCIQAVDYSRAREEGARSVPDSLIREYATQGGRKVYDGGGIEPDLHTEPEYISRFAMTLYALGFIEDYGDRFMRLHPDRRVDVRTFALTDADYADFVRFMSDKEVPYESTTRRALKALRKAAGDERHEAIDRAAEALEAELRDDTESNLETYRREIRSLLEADIVLRHHYAEGVIEYDITHDDAEVRRAAEVLENPGEYRRILDTQDTVRTARHDDETDTEE
ncbi:S41 family peptidase [uncultured Alistipes sp.]|uniref:S41 family peptidase n=1 Tax=uncultured Alistipes sp. TaxID=538949 RepID=UPI00261935CF|nr:S41 family peptidase [uncultured Alistipes sp.]